jgi:DNA-binding transcriptional LysR family regulator
MRRPDDHSSIPTDLLRSVVVVAEAGSFSKAAKALGLSRSSLAAQMKRLQKLTAGPIFETGPNGRLNVTSRGQVVIALAQRVLDANDQMLALGGHIEPAQRLRVGVTTNYAEYLLASLGNSGSQYRLTTGYSSELAHLLSVGDLDIACLANAPAELGRPSFSWIEEFAWVCSRAFALQAGHPIPLVACEGILGDQMINALEGSGVPFTVVFSSADHNARVMATAAGMGVMALPARHVRDPLMITKEAHLPAMRALKMDVLVRQGIEPQKISHVIELMKALAPADFRSVTKT